MISSFKKISFWIGLALILSASIWKLGIKPNSGTEYLSRKILAYHEQEEQSLQTYLKDQAFLDYFLARNQLRYMKDIEQSLAKLERLEEESFALLLNRGNTSIMASTKMNILPNWLAEIKESPKSILLKTHHNHSWIIKKYALGGADQAIAFFPLSNKEMLQVKEAKAIENKQAWKALPFKGLEQYYFSYPDSKSGSFSLIFYLFLIGSFLFWFGIDAWVYDLLQRQVYLWFFVLLFGTGFGLNIFWSQLSYSFQVGRIFESINDQVLLGHNPAQLLLNSLLFLWLGAYFHHFFYQRTHFTKRYFIQLKSFGLYLLSILMLGALAWWLKEIILRSTTFFNLEDSLQIKDSGLLLASSLVVLLMGYFLFVFTFFLKIKDWQLSLNARLLLMVLAIMVAIPLINQFDLGFPIWIWSLMAFILLVLLDLFVDGEDFNLTWLLVWVIMLSAFSASLCYKYILDKDVQLMEAYAYRFLEEESAIAVQKEAYVSQHYQVSDTLSVAPLSRLPYERRQLIRQYMAAPLYDFKGMEYLSRYNYVLLKDGELIDRQKEVVDLDLLELSKVAANIPLLKMKSSRLTLAIADENAQIIVLQRELGSYFKPLSLFAFFFMLFLLALIALALIHQLLPLIPPFFYEVFQTRNSLQNRIQLSVIGIILGSSLVIGLVTVNYFKSVARERRNRAALEESVQVEQFLEKALSFEDTTKAVDAPPLVLNESALYNNAFSIYGIDGKRIYSNLPLGIQMTHISPVALETLKIKLLPYVIRPFGAQGGRAIYSSINDQEGTVRAYIEIPFSYNDSSSQQEINNFVGSIFSIYVFFMFIAGGIAIWVANSITEPIGKIGEGLRQLKLGNNQPLIWKNEDEIGVLIQEYNKALDKLEESTQKLRLSEREGAWREMAKQVAHEIKNPLTPMKLSVQYLLRAYQSNPEGIGPLLKRMSNTLIEQIEGLSKIANEFSHFAKMPKAEMQALSFNAVLTSVVALFKEASQDVDIQLSLPEEEIQVLADKDQLIRVFNNLIKNAGQAIPDDREGHIKVKLVLEEGKAIASVTDNGKGIAPELREKVFYPNFTTKSSGTGIGLSMSRNIIEQFGGRIYFQTEEGKGTSFFVELDEI